uniref:Uncharacterized protein n=1 Tax=Sphaerodactylus townsendi TaxID=933632 RepID=A0ACB8EAE1_9SAUR
MAVYGSPPVQMGCTGELGPCTEATPKIWIYLILKGCWKDFSSFSHPGITQTQLPLFVRSLLSSCVGFFPVYHVSFLLRKNALFLLRTPHSVVKLGGLGTALVCLCLPVCENLALKPP